MKDASKFMLGIAATLVFVAIVGGTYYFGQSQQKKSVPLPTPKSTSIPQETPAPTLEPTATPKQSLNKSMVIENIEASVQSKNYAALEGYMASQVSVILYATKYSGILSAQKATEQMSYLNNGTPPWDFSSSSTIAQKLINTDPANFAGRVIGVTSSGMAVSFNLNAQNKIDKIFISADYKLIAP